jgi:hypothetical protein
MQKQPLFPDADAYVASLDGWRRECVDRLRASVKTQGKLQETVKWGHLVYEANGPVLLIRAEPERVLFGFWRGQRLRGIEPALRESGKYEMATIEIREGMPVDAATARRLAEAAVALNEELGDPRLEAKRTAPPAPKRTAAKRSATTVRGSATAAKRAAARNLRAAGKSAAAKQTAANKHRGAKQASGPANRLGTSARRKKTAQRSRAGVGTGPGKNVARASSGRTNPARRAKKSATSRRTRKAAHRGG